MNFVIDSETADLKEHDQVKFGESISQSGKSALRSEIRSEIKASNRCKKTSLRTLV